VREPDPTTGFTELVIGFERCEDHLMTLRVREPMDRPLGRGMAQDANASRSGEPRPTSVASHAFGALALGAFAIGALAIGAIAIGRLAIGRARIRRLEIDELIVRRLRVIEELSDPSKAGPED
jgi:hypothetical protein